ncbi:MAG: hypothetical protein FJY97_02715 [candidate division Zixibacteria bacterium]|nr:hypothetical protein [candidate division Zixibacteria bacterium]
MSSPHESADLILKLYELRREDTMRKARDWFTAFNPDSLDDIRTAVQGEHSAYYRMVTSYWDMAASLVNNGGIDEKMFTDANGEHMAVFAKVEPFVAEIRQHWNMPQYLVQLEQLILRQPNAKERLAQLRERLRAMTARRSS